MSVGVLVECEVPGCVRQLILHADQESGFFSLSFLAAQFNLEPDSVRVLDSRLVPVLVVQEASNPSAVLPHTAVRKNGRCHCAGLSWLKSLPSCQVVHRPASFSKCWSTS